LLDVVVIGSDLRQSLRWISDRRAAAMIGEVWPPPAGRADSLSASRPTNAAWMNAATPEDHFVDSRDRRLPNAWAALIKQ
jgi:hypothetical protein